MHQVWWPGGDLVITGIPEGSIVLTPHAARIIYQMLPVKETRTRLSSRTQGWQVLNAITQCAFHLPADSGINPRQLTETDEREHWTVSQVARAAKVSERTVRNDCESGQLDAKKIGRPWVIHRDAATTYIASKRKN